nr:unnamed protein product [Callosobruchus chinensis]
MNIHKKGKNNSSYKSKSLKKYKRRINHCKHCEAVYKSKAVRDDHVLKKHPEFIASVTSKIHRCEICTYKTTIKVELDRHMLKHPDVKSNYKLKLNTCLHCKATFKSKATMDDHIIRKHPECMESVTSKVHECKVCAFKTTNKRQFENHMLKHPEENSGLKMSTCSHCSAEFKSKRGLDNHTLSSHPEYIATVTSKVHECKVCLFKTTVKCNLDAHVLEHSGEKHKFKSSACLHCEKSFTSKATMDDHIIRKHPEFMESVTSKVHECKVCLFKTTNKRQFELHTLRHPDSYSSYKPSTCPHCNAEFNTKRGLDDHIVKKHPAFIQSVTSKIHECKVCFYRTTLKNHFNSHMFNHPGERASYNFNTCIHCTAVFRTSAARDNHILKKHPECTASVTRRVYECKVCIYKTTCKDKFDRHMSTHPEENSCANLSTCMHCKEVFRNRKDLDDHILKSHPTNIGSITSKIHDCKICYFRTTLKHRMDTHMLKHPEANYTPKVHACRVCGTVFKSKISMDDHIVKHHTECVESVTSKIHECKICLYRTTFKHCFDAHMLKHPELNPTFKFHTCMVCNSAFKSRIGMDDHIVKLHPESIELVTSRIHECKSCVYKTTYKDRFDTHMLRHPEADPSKFSVCVACNATFRSKQKMDDHVLKQHPEFTESVTSKIHECKVCLYRTTFKDRLSNHMATHPDTNTVNQPTCRHCNRSFNSRVAMDDHILKKHPTCIDSVTSKMHECELCTFKTTFKHNLDRHMLKQHTAGKSSS